MAKTRRRTKVVEPYVVMWSTGDDHIWVGLIRTYQSAQFPEVMKFLVDRAKEKGLPYLRGQVTGEHRLRLFRMKGWKQVARLSQDIWVVEYRVP